MASRSSERRETCQKSAMWRHITRQPKTRSNNDERPTSLGICISFLWDGGEWRTVAHPSLMCCSGFFFSTWPIRFLSTLPSLLWPTFHLLMCLELKCRRQWFLPLWQAFFVKRKLWTVRRVENVVVELIAILGIVEIECYQGHLSSIGCLRRWANSKHKKRKAWASRNAKWHYACSNEKNGQRNENVPSFGSLIKKIVIWQQGGEIPKIG